MARPVRCGPTPAEQRRTELDDRVAAAHAASDGVYGAPRILADLREGGERVSRKTVAASLRRQGLAGISPRRFTPVTTLPDPSVTVPTDLVEGGFDTGVLNRVCTSDITSLRTGEGWLYLCAVRDGCARRVLGQCPGGIILGDTENRVLRPRFVADRTRG
ncbi:IS3 family transposase [Skermania piniformis]|uniref:IS3 family transposase n=1 Tax=Skermania pinensis TaxID=39122 RepID=UPI000AAC10EE|nr:IS3 family transposase [Skermania piniformis]